MVALESKMRRVTELAILIAILPLAVAAQERPRQGSPPPPQPEQHAQPAAPEPQAAQQNQGGSEWSKMPRMQLERQFAGPLRDTVIQRWRDPNDGTICYIYLPISAPSGPPTPPGYVQYGSSTIGSISCLHENPKPAAPAKR